MDAECARAADLDGVTVVSPRDVRTSAGEESTEKTTARQILESASTAVREGTSHRWAPSQGRDDDQEQDQAPNFHG